SDVKYVLVYRTKGNKQPDINNPENILVKIRYPATIYIDKGVFRGKYSYAITVIDRMNNESTPLFSEAIKCNNQ
ncbi:MAG: hypothetical protein OEY34_06325, partial [Cyclobacteriaceae bacterium]|nr:hypothetical protein [Cyclobacteriaceae bacterium]